MARTVIRTESHRLTAPLPVREDVVRTVDAYRRAVRALCTLLMTHWPTLAPAPSKCQAVEALFHATAARPTVRYPMLGRLLGTMPSYLRRAAIEAAFGAVSSYLSNYSLFLDGQMGGQPRQEGARPPRLGLSNVFPSLYGGNMLRDGHAPKPLRAQGQPDFIGPVKPRSPQQRAAAAAKAARLATPPGTVRLKLLQADGQWRFSAPLTLKGKPKRLTGPMALSPTLVQRGAKVWLACPVEVTRPVYLTNTQFAAGDPRTHRVCSIDVGITTAATAAIVEASGTVIARTFLTCGRHNDQRDALAADIAEKRRLSGGNVRGQAFCRALYRRIEGLSLDAARQLASALLAFAQRHGAQVFVLEDLKGWRPKGRGRKQRQRFHRFEHRKLVSCLKQQAEEAGLRVLEVFARGTSRWAYDGSGKVTRSRDNAQLATFASGKQYNADLNGALNIAARGLALLLGVPPRTESHAETGKSSGSVARMPLVLADIWDYCQRPAPAAALGVARAL